MKTRLLIILFALCTVSLFGQETQQTESVIVESRARVPQVSKNTVGVNYSAMFLPDVVSIVGGTVYYEYLLTKNPSKPTFYLRGGLGGLVFDDNIGIQIPISLIYLGGKKNSHFETDLGFRALFASREIFPYPVLNFGYRYQPPGEGVFFKALLGSDGLTLGLGYAF